MPVRMKIDTVLYTISECIYTIFVLIFNENYVSYGRVTEEINEIYRGHDLTNFISNKRILGIKSIQTKVDFPRV